MSDKDFTGVTNKPGGHIASTEAGDALLEKLCELLDAEVTNNEAVLECLAELKLLTAANNDAVALAEILASLEAVCDKLLAQADQNVEILTALQALCDKILESNESLEALCEKIEQGNADQLDCLEDIKEALAAILTALECLVEMKESLEAICEKLDAANDLLTALLAAVVAQTAILTSIEANQTGMSCDNPTHVTSCDPQGTVDQCCTGGATETTAKCANIPKSWTTMSLGDYDRCTASFGGIDLPDDNYTYADFEALILGVGGTIAPNPNNPEQYTICVPNDFTTCYNRACFQGKVGQLTRACVIAVPNTAEEECKDFDRVWTKYEEPIGDLIATQNDILEDMLDCPKPLPLECLKKRTFCVGYDNGRTAGSSTNNCGGPAGFVRFDWPFEVVGWEVNGQSVGAGEALGPFANWGAQLQGWADFMNANDPNFVEGECEADFDILPAPTWRYSKITCCNPTAKYGPITLRRTDTGCEYTIYPVLTSDSVETANRFATIDCDGNKTLSWCDVDGNPLEEAPENPACFVPCDFIFGDYVYGPSIDCEQDVYNVCDNGTEPSTPFVSVITNCEGERTVENYTLESWTTAQNSDELVPHELIGEIVDCATGELFEFPESLDEQILAKLCEANELAEVDLAKQCLMEDHLNPSSPCPADVPPEGLDKELQTLTLMGNVVANYPAGQSINLMDANGQSCGEATVSSEAAAVYNEEAGMTVITIEECELDEGKEAQQVTQAKPQTALVATAIKTVTAFAIKKAVVTVKKG